MIRSALGLLAAMASALAVAFAGGCILGILVWGKETDWRDGALVAWGASFFLVPSILVLTMPLHRLACNLRRTRGTNYALVGAVVGTGVFFAVQLLASAKALDFPGQMRMPGLAIAPTMGAAASLTFWGITRPDRGRSN
jgi:hypothetical protein